MTTGGGRFDFDDGGTYCGGWEDGKAHGHGVCTGPKGLGEYAGAWQYGFEASGVYTWPSGNMFQGQWLQGKRHGLGVESKGKWLYKGEWTQGFKGRYGVRVSTSSGAKYEGTWTTGIQDGYGCETYADGGTYQGQWLRGTRHGYGVRQSVPYGLAAQYRSKALRASLTSLRSEAEEEYVVKDRDKKMDETRGGFVLKGHVEDEDSTRRLSLFDKRARSSLKKSIMSGLKLRKQKSTGDITEGPRRPSGSVRSTRSMISQASIDSTMSTASAVSTQSALSKASRYSDSNHSFVSQEEIMDANITETYMGEWKNDKRSGFGISERTDGLKYEGEWFNNKKYGFGVTTFRDGVREEGKYKNNVLISSGKKHKLFVIQKSKLRERIDTAVLAAQRAAQLALQKADIAVSRMANARAKAEQANLAAERAMQDSDVARIKAKELAPEFHQPGTDIMKKRLLEQQESGESPPLPSHFNHNNHQRSRSLVPRQTSYADSPTLDNHLMPSPIKPLSSAISGTGPPSLQDYRHEEKLPAVLSDRTNGDPDRGGIDAVAFGRDQRDYSRDLRDYGRDQRDYGRDQRDYARENHISSRSHVSMTQQPKESVPYGRNGMENQPVDRLSSLLNSTVLDDHFDQYRTSGARDDIHYSPLGGVNKPVCDPSPDSGISGVSDSTDDSHVPFSARRSSLPGIIKRNASLGRADGKPTQPVKPSKTAEDIVHRQSDTFIIENGIRKRVKVETHGKPLAEASSLHPSMKPKIAEIPKRFKLEAQKPLSKYPNKGSLPDISVVGKDIEKRMMSREEVSALSTQQRKKMIEERQLNERRERGDVAVRLNDLKEWVQQRQLLMLVITLNVGLATVFFSLMSPQ